MFHISFLPSIPYLYYSTCNSASEEVDSSWPLQAIFLLSGPEEGKKNLYFLARFDILIKQRQSNIAGLLYREASVHPGKTGE